MRLTDILPLPSPPPTALTASEAQPLSVLASGSGTAAPILVARVPQQLQQQLQQLEHLKLLLQADL